MPGAIHHHRGRLAPVRTSGAVGRMVMTMPAHNFGGTCQISQIFPKTLGNHENPLSFIVKSITEKTPNSLPCSWRNKAWRRGALKSISLCHGRQRTLDLLRVEIQVRELVLEVGATQLPPLQQALGIGPGRKPREFKAEKNQTLGDLAECSLDVLVWC